MMDNQLSNDGIARFRRDSYLAFGPVLDGAAVERLRAALDELQAGWAAELGVTVDEYVRVVSQWTNVWEKHPAFAEQLRHPTITSAAARLIGCERVRVFHDHVISKPPVANGTVPWHQDYPYWPINAPRAVSCWMALDNVDVESGCMHFMPGAHRDGEKKAVDFLNDSTVWGTRAAEVRAVPLAAGSCVFHDCLSWHTTPPNTTLRQRRAYIAIFMDADCTYDPSHSEWHPMNKRTSVPPGSIFNDDAFPVVGAR